MTTKRYLILLSLVPFAFFVTLNCMDDNNGVAGNNNSNYYKAKINYFTAKSSREEAMNSDWTHAKRTGISTGIQLIGIWADRGACNGADIIRKKYFGLTETEEAEKEILEKQVETNKLQHELKQEEINTKKAENSLLTTRDLNERIEALIRLCDYINEKECNCRMKDLLAELDKKNKPNN